MILTAENISKEYRDGKNHTVRVLHSFSMTFESGKSYSLVGRSGVGKSTLLNMLGGLDVPSQGRVLYDGEAISRLDASRRAKIRSERVGFVFQFHQLLPDFSARENIMMPLLIRGQDERDAGKRADELLEKVGLSGRAHHRPAELSGGEQQRTAVARALSGKPQLLLADEPTGNLDPETAEGVRDLLIEVQKELKMTMLLVTHSHELARRLDAAYELLPGGGLKVLSAL